MMVGLPEGEGTMVASDISTGLSGRPRVLGRTLASIGVGILVGALYDYAIAVAASAPVPGGFTTPPLTLALIAIVAALAVATAWRWPVVGLTAGIVVLGLVAFAVGGRIGWTPYGYDWWSPFNAVAFGAASGYPTIVGATMITSAALSLRRTHQPVGE